MEAFNTAACGSIKGFATPRAFAAPGAVVAASDPTAHLSGACRETGMRYAFLFMDITYPAPSSSRWRHRPGRAIPR
jgi:hypothetical protein